MNPQEFATFYIARELPWPTIDMDGDSPTDIPAPFKKVVLKPEYLGVRELRLRDEIHGLGKVKKALHSQMVPNSAGTENDLKNLNLNELYHKGRMWCETNQRLVDLQKCPQTTAASSTLLASKFSDLHQEAVQDAKECNTALEHVNDNDVGKSEQVALRAAGSEEEKQVPSDLILDEVKEPPESKLDRKLHELFGEMTPLKPPSEIPKKAEKTQYDLITVEPSIIDAKARHRPPKPFWKKNKYPLQTRHEVIAERRKLARPLTVEELELDYLPGIWEPQLMVNEFVLTSISHDSRIVKDEERDENYEAISWYEMQERNEKCAKWLSSSQD